MKMSILSLLRQRNNNHSFFVSIARLITSFFGALLFNIPWLIIFISLGKNPEELIRILLWGVAPLIIASGYTYGIILFDRIVFSNHSPFHLILPWALVGCVFGEIISLPSGPMVIGLSIFILGGIGVLLRELKIIYKIKRKAGSI